MAHSIPDEVVVVRWGDTFYVVDPAHAASAAETHAHALGRFPFTGAASRRNPDALRAFDAAKAHTRLLMEA